MDWVSFTIQDISFSFLVRTIFYYYLSTKKNIFTTIVRLFDGQCEYNSRVKIKFCKKKKKSENKVFATITFQ